EARIAFVMYHYSDAAFSQAEACVARNIHGQGNEQSLLACLSSLEGFTMTPVDRHKFSSEDEYNRFESNEFNRGNGHFPYCPPATDFPCCQDTRTTEPGMLNVYGHYSQILIRGCISNAELMRRLGVPTK